MKQLKKNLKPLRNLFVYFWVMVGYYFTRMLPIPAMHAFAKFAGFFVYAVPSLRMLIIANLKVAFPEKESREIRQIARKSCTNVVLFGMEFFWFTNRHDKLAELMYMSVEQKKLMAECRDNKTGLIWVVPHLGNWELARIGISNANFPMSVVARTMDNPYLNKLINAGRKADGSNVIPAKGAVKGMIKALKEGSIVATLVDQNTRARDGGIFVNFFGLPVSASRAPAMFGRKFNAVLALSGATRKGYGYEMIFKKMAKPASEYNSDEELIQDIMKLVEDLVREYPEQYLWMYKRWNYIPAYLDGEKKECYPYYATEVTERFFSDKGKKPPKKKSKRKNRKRKEHRN